MAVLVAWISNVFILLFAGLMAYILKDMSTVKTICICVTGFLIFMFVAKMCELKHRHKFRHLNRKWKN